MQEQDLKHIWKQSSQAAAITIDAAALQQQFHQKTTRIERDIRRRDRSEIGASVFGMIAFTYLAYELPFVLCKIGALLNIAWFIYLIYRLRNNKRLKLITDLSLPYRQQLSHQKTNMQQEARLLHSVWYWYVLPSLTIYSMIVLGFGDPIAIDWTPWLIEKLQQENLLHLLPITTPIKLAYLIGALVFGGFIIWMNRFTVRKRITPIIAMIEQIEHELTND